MQAIPAMMILQALNLTFKGSTDSFALFIDASMELAGEFVDQEVGRQTLRVHEERAREEVRKGRVSGMNY